MFSEDNGNNYSDSSSYYLHMSQHSTYAGFIELMAAGELFPYCFEEYHNNELYKVLGYNGNPTKRLCFTSALFNGNFDIYEIQSHLMLTPSPSEGNKQVKK